MNFGKIFSHRLVLQLCNFLFLSTGVILFTSGILLFSDGPRVLLSRLLGSTNEHLAELEQPLFYYVALGLSAAGLLIILTSMIGCWAAHLNSVCVLSFYFLIVISLLLTEFGVCLLITMWPHCLGLNLDSTAMVKSLQRNYGISGQEQFTAAMDYAQTKFECCAINNNINYDLSLWRLQKLGQADWTVPLTCCHLSNRNRYQSYLDPQPRNLTQCQSLQREVYALGRHLDGCLEKIETWYSEQHFLFLIGGLAIAIVEFCVLLGIILSCTRVTKKSGEITVRTEEREIITIPAIQNVYQETGLPELPTEFRESFVQPQNFHKNRHVTTFKPSSQQYQIPKSYLV